MNNYQEVMKTIKMIAKEQGKPLGKMLEDLRNNAFLTRIAHKIAHKKRPSDPQTRGGFVLY